MEDAKLEGPVEVPPGSRWGNDNPSTSLWAVLGLDTFIPYLIPVGTHTLRLTDLGLEPALVGCGTLGRLLDSSELSHFSLRSKGNNLLPPRARFRLRGFIQNPCPRCQYVVDAQ